jgi:Zn-dependent protease with chaperone function
MAALVTLSATAVVWFVVTALVALVSGRVVSRVDAAPSADRAAALFCLRVMPFVASFAIAFGIVLPLFLWFEPGNSDERVPVSLIVAAVFGCGLVAQVLWRASVGVRATRTLARRWQTEGRVVACDTPFPVVAVDQPFPSVAIVGFRRPVLFMSTRVLCECPPDELRAMIAHERAHYDARDNVKRLLLRMCPSIPGRSSRLDEAWQRAAEEAADAAAATVPEQALSLAQALVRVARLATTAAAIAPVSAFYEAGDIEARVRRLLKPIQRPAAKHPSSGWFVTAGVLAVGSIAAVAPAIHQAMEATLAWLP